MKILIAEDSAQKEDDLIDYFRSLDIEQLEIHVAKSFKESIRQILSKDFNLVILDMSMPSKSGSLSFNNRTLAGKDILSTVKFNKINTTKFIVFSQFSEFGRHDDVVSLPEIYLQLEAQFKELLLGCVKYDSSSDLWKKELSALIKSFL